MRIIHKYSQIVDKVLLCAAISAVWLVSARTEAQSAPKSRAKAQGKVKPAVANRPGALRLKLHSFPDVSMGAPSAYTVILPPQWSAQGKVEWQPVGKVPFPQQMFEIISPEKGNISFEPSVTFSYMEGPGITTPGVAPPANFPQWLSQAIAATNSKVSDVKLVSSRRNKKFESALEKMNRASGGGGGMQREVWMIVLDYTEAKVRRRQEINVAYTRFEPYLSPNMNSQLWNIAPALSISAPANRFAALRPLLLNVAGTVRPTPQWHIQSQALIADMARQRIENNWQVIRERGRQIGQVSDAQYAKYKKDMSRGDEAQRQRINTINETDDFKDTTGNIVNLPMHYNHVFSDGKGNYVLSNNSQDKPGQQWKPIRPMK